MLRLGVWTKGSGVVDLTINERRQGTYIIGTTGTGKSTLLKNIIYQDMLNDTDSGLCLLDPHGDLIDEILEIVPPHRKDDVILFNPMDMERPFGLNLLACDIDDPHQVRWVVSTIMGTLRRLFHNSWGPSLEHVLRHALLTVLQRKDTTFVDLFLLLTHEAYRKTFLAGIEDPFLKHFWHDYPTKATAAREYTLSTVNKITPFVTDRTMRNIIGQSRSTLDLSEVMDKGKILLVNLSKGDLGEENSSLLGAVIVNLVLITALQRRKQPKALRKPFHLIVDEFQNFATESFAVLQSEARKYAVDVIVAHQYRDQLDDLLKGSTFNVGNIIAFRVTGLDSYALASQFDNTPPTPDTRVDPVYRPIIIEGKKFFIETRLSTSEGKLYEEVYQGPRMYSDVEAQTANDLSILPNYRAWCRLIRDRENEEQRIAERHILTDNIDELLKPNPRMAQYIRERSRSLASTREIVEHELKTRFGDLTGLDKATQTSEDIRS